MLDVFIHHHGSRVNQSPTTHQASSPRHPWTVVVPPPPPQHPTICTIKTNLIVSEQLYLANYPTGDINSIPVRRAKPATCFRSYQPTCSPPLQLRRSRALRYFDACIHPGIEGLAPRPKTPTPQPLPNFIEGNV